MNYFEQESAATGVDDIKAIWVASDDPSIVDEIRTLAPTYFPHVLSEAIVYAADGVTGGPTTRGVDTFTKTQVCSTPLGEGSHCHYITASTIEMSTGNPRPSLDEAQILSHRVRNATGYTLTRYLVPICWCSLRNAEEGCSKVTID